MKQYYLHYLSLHKNGYNKLCHFLGQLMTIFCISYIIYISYRDGWQHLFYLPITWFVTYPFAWFGHFIFEKNEPAAFRNPLMAKISDWIMFYEILMLRHKLWT